MQRLRMTSLAQIIGITGMVCLFQSCGGGFAPVGQDKLNGASEAEQTIVEGDETLFLKFQTVVNQHCTKCHGAENSPFGGIADFTQFKTQQDWIDSPRQLIMPSQPEESPMYYRLSFAKGKVANSNNNMPFAFQGQAPSMTEEEAQAVYNYIESVQVKSNPLASCDESYSPGEVNLRRLNASELRNSVKDLFGIDNSFETLPEATAGQFSNIGKFQTLDETFFKFYSEGAAAVAAQVAANQAGPISACNKNINCIQNLLNPIAELAYRKRLNAQDHSTYRRAIQAVLGNSTYNYTGQEAFAVGLESILLNPQFLYVIRQGSNSGERQYNDFELATRLSLTLFSSIPDRALWQKANVGDLTSKYQQVLDELMSSSRFVDRFVTQFSEGWLGISKVDGLTPQKSSYGLNTNEFRPIGEAMKQSVELYLRHVLEQELNVDSLANGSQRFLNDQLASHLGIDGNFNSNFRLVNLPNSSPYSRTGLLTTTPLVTSSLSDRESIVFRGVQVLGAFACEVPPPPPDDVVAEIEEMNFPAGTSQREMLESHSNNSRCASCHQTFDPYGFGLSHFDGLGRFRTQDEHGNPIDAKGTIGTVTFDNHQQLAEMIVSEKNFRKCISQTLMTFAIGKEFDPKSSKPDMCTVNRVVAEAPSGSMKEIFKKVLSDRYFKSWLDQ